MIVPMIKYDIVLLSVDKERFLNKLQDLGLVDITTTGWEPDEQELELIASIERHSEAVEYLRAIVAGEGEGAAEPYANSNEAWHRFLEAYNRLYAINRRIKRVTRETEALKMWGVFDGGHLRELEQNGVVLRYFSMYTKEFETQVEEWSKLYTVVPINEHARITYFVMVAASGEEVGIDAHEIKTLTATYEDCEQELVRLEMEKIQWNKDIDRAAASLAMIEEHWRREQDRLDFNRVSHSVAEAAEGTLVVMEGWATRATAGKVDKLLQEYPALVHIKSDPTPVDDTPVVLKNGRFAEAFEFIGSFYSLPRYGTTDLTPFFAPFYMLFFGLCLADAGYGLLFVIAGIVMTRKAKPVLRGMGRLVMYCGIATVICGIFLGSFFGVPFAEYAPFVAFQQFVLTHDNMFYLALGIGVFQILFAMCIKIYTTTKAYGFRYALSAIGWLLVILSVLYWAQNRFNLNLIPYSYILMFSGIAAGLFMMLFLNSPGRNPLVNLGSGLWKTYNDATGLLSDVLSYIRLFAIGLAGGILALVFNDLALGLSPEIPVIKQLVMVIILTIGHGLNLFMGTLSSFVHPMRLTFVEFYKNAGFEPASREFAPFKREKENMFN